MRFKLTIMLPKNIQETIDEFSKLPGIGPKTASRLTFYLLSKTSPDVEKLGQTIHDLKKNLQECKRCFNISTKELCEICDDPKRDQKKIMVVEEPLDIVALEKTDYQGIYHVLGGQISPIDGIGPEDLRIKQLMDRVKGENIEELILSTDPSLEGEATAMYISKQIEKLKSANRGPANSGNESTKLKKLSVTRIARGLPVGSDLEYADEITLTRALEGRREY